MKGNALNVQTEHLEDHTARMTVEVDPARLDRAKQSAAREISKRVRIPGFRKGKVPYRILVQNGLEGEIIRDAVSTLGQEVYREMLDEVEVEPYGPGSLEDFELEPTVTFTYSLPLQPTVELGDYRSVRVEYEEPEVTDEMVDSAMKMFQEQEALVEESSQPAAMGNRVTADVHSEFADDPPAVADSVGEEGAEDHDTEQSPHPNKGDTFVHEHDAQLKLDEADDPVLPGFSKALEGANAGDDVEFELTVPDDDPDYDEEIRGRRVKFTVAVNKIETITLPELNDDLAARITKDEEEPLSLLELRVRTRENIKSNLDQQTREAYANQVLDQIISGASIAYPEMMVEEQIDSMLEDLQERLGQRGITLDLYMEVTGKSKEDLQAEYRPQAEESIKRALVFRELIDAEKIDVPEEDIEARVEEMMAEFSGEAQDASIRSMIDNPRMRSMMRTSMLQQRVTDRIIAIGKGEEPEVTSTESTSEAEADEDKVDITEAEQSDETT
jgi:trigger factor